IDPEPSGVVHDAGLARGGGITAARLGVLVLEPARRFGHRHGAAVWGRVPRASRSVRADFRGRLIERNRAGLQRAARDHAVAAVRRAKARALPHEEAERRRSGGGDLVVDTVGHALALALDPVAAALARVGGGPGTG